MKLTVVILAAGQGTRMRSRLPKVLHRLGGRPLLQHVYETATALNPEAITVVYGHGGEQVRSRYSEWPVTWVEQAQQLGTGHAVQQVPLPEDEGTVLILYGDVPLLKKSTLDQLLLEAGPNRLALLTVNLGDPKGYGRIVRDREGRVQRIVEEKDASSQEKQITEVNTGIMAAPAKDLKRWLQQLENNNAQGEYYLTDVIAMAVKDGVEVATVMAEDEQEVQGINNKEQLAELERALQKRQANQLLDQGVTLIDPSRFDLRGTLEVGRDVEIDVNVVIEGQVKLGDRVKIGPNVIISNSVVGDDVQILSHCLVEEAEIGSGCRVGPFARIRPGTRLIGEVHIGNFVEIKKSVVGRGSKINHLSYVGDSEVGSGVNIGAGTITCNYDGVHKHRTIIEDDAFIGSDTQLVAPVKVGRGATIGAGSTITRDAPAERLTLSRSQQTTIDHWRRPEKNDPER